MNYQNRGKTTWLKNKTRRKFKLKELEYKTTTQRRQQEQNIDTIKFFTYKMANTVAYPGFALEKIIRFDSSEDPTAFFPLPEKN